MRQQFNKLINKLVVFVVSEYKDYKLLLQACPTVTLIVYVLSVICMNLFANKQLVDTQYLALDCGFLISWVSFLCMDMLTQRFGAKPAIKLSLFATGCNLCCAGIFFIVANVGTTWSAYYTYQNSVVNFALNSTFSGTWYVLAGSTAASISSSIVNAVINVNVGKLCNHANIDLNKEYVLRSSISTALGQLVDNLVFASIVSKVFFGWTWTQVIVCAVTGGLFELVSEMIFSRLGLYVCNIWEQHGVGQDYLTNIADNR